MKTMRDVNGIKIRLDNSLCCQGKPKRETQVFINLKILIYAMAAFAVVGWIICEISK